MSARARRWPGGHLLRWLARSRARGAPLSIEITPDAGRSVHARAGIARDATVLEIPLRCLLTTEVACASAVGRAVEASGVSLRSRQSIIAAALLGEHLEPGSRWRPYLCSLPASFPTHPLFFGEDDLALLQGSFTLAKIASRRASIQQDYQALCDHVPEIRRFSYASFQHARVAVTSRIFGLTIDGKKTEALVPLADMLNHRYPPETHWTYDDEAGAFVMTALRPFAAGEPIHDSYGHKCNSRFFVSYGFALEDNEDNEAAVRLGGPSAGAFQLSARPDDGSAREALSFLRAARAGQHRELARGGEVGPESARNEAAVLRDLAAACEEALAAFSTTLEQDDALLAEGKLGPRARVCVVQRRGEKRVLRGWIDLAAAALPILRLPWARLESVVRERSGDGDLDRYLRSVVSALAAQRRAERPTIQEEASP